MDRFLFALMCVFVDNWIVTTGGGEIKFEPECFSRKQEEVPVELSCGLEYLCFLLACVWEANEKKKKKINF